MSEHATQLSVTLVDELFGELPSVGIYLPCHLVLWYDADNGGQALYEADVSNSYTLARSGRYFQLVKERLGDNAGNIILNFSILGHVRMGDLIRTYFPSPDERGPLHEVIPTDHRSCSNDNQFIELKASTHGDVHTVHDFQSTINDLLSAGLLCPVHESHFRPAADNITEAEHVVPRDNQIRSKREEQAAWELAVRKKLEHWKYGSEADTDVLARTQKGTKRTFDDDDDTPTVKKRKLMNLQSEGMNGTCSDPYLGDVGSLDNDRVLRINHEKLAVIMRNQQLVALVEESIGPITAKVYAAILHLAESQLRKCKTELDVSDDDDEIDLLALPQVSTNELSRLMQDLPDLSDAIGYADPSRINLNILEHPKKTKRRPHSNDLDSQEALVEGSASSDESDGKSDDSKSDMTGIDHDSDFTDGDEGYSSKTHKHKTPDTTPDTTPKIKDPQSPLHTLRQHLFLLIEHPRQFLVRIPRQPSAPESWAIPYHALSRTLLHNALLSITTSRFGPLAGRLLRILGANNTNSSNPYPKLDEKMLVLLSLIPQKPMRTILHSMHRAGHIELQELPKDGNQRRPGTTLFFWFFDADRMRKRVLEETYKAMTNLIRRARVEKEGVRAVVEKSERTDVVGREEEFLGEEELRALREWRAKEERIWGQVGRLDELVAVLRDF
ncbi:MAG: hypothetical protein Q9225_004395 [Loekoesia sp. 1 TL-2023]